jgi:hypothetical protein
MKNQLVVGSLLMMLVTAGCARRTQVVDQLSNRVMQLKNQFSGMYHQKDVVVGQDKMQILGTFEQSEIPATIRKLDIGSQVGTLDLIVEKTTYKTKYRNEAKPKVEEVREETSMPVHLIEHQGRKALAIKRNLEGAGIAVKYEPVLVQSEYKEYVSKIYVRELNGKQLFPRESVSIESRVAFCNIEGICQLEVGVAECGTLEGIPYCNPHAQRTKKIMNIPLAGDARFSLSYGVESTQRDFTKRETLQNTSKPLKALIRLLPDYATDFGALQFDL